MELPNVSLGFGLFGLGAGMWFVSLAVGDSEYQKDINCSNENVISLYTFKISTKKVITLKVKFASRPTFMKGGETQLI